MMIEIHGTRVDITARIREQVQRKAEYSLGRFESAIRAVHVTLEDANGPRGGVDQVCRIVVNVENQASPVIAEAIHEQTGGAIELAFGKVAHAMSRSLDRRKSRRRQAVEV